MACEDYAILLDNFQVSAHHYTSIDPFFIDQYLNKQIKIFIPNYNLTFTFDRNKVSRKKYGKHMCQG